MTTHDRWRRAAHAAVDAFFDCLEDQDGEGVYVEDLFSVGTSSRAWNRLLYGLATVPAGTAVTSAGIAEALDAPIDGTLSGLTRVWNRVPDRARGAITWSGTGREEAARVTPTVRDALRMHLGLDNPIADKLDAEGDR